MKVKQTLLVFLFAVAYVCSYAQGTLQIDTTIQVIENGNALPKPWTGGLDCPMYSAMDINNDGVKDMIVFDHKTNRLTTYINNNTPGVSYRYAPEYVQYFPVLQAWIKLYDYNCDGFEDIFTYGSGGIACYKNNGTNPLSFTLITGQINSWYHLGSTFFLSNIWATSVNVPTFVDMDDDGDMDIIGFANGGSYLDYHKNYSMDSLGICSGFRFYNIRVCWGYFVLDGSANKAYLPPLAIASGNCPAYPATYPRNSYVDERMGVLDTLRHAGSLLEALDMEDDDDKDLLIGDIVGKNLLYIENGGNHDSAYAVSQDTLFPLYDTSVLLDNIAAPYIMDVNNDGKKDMLVANFNADFFQGSGENYFSTQLYENVSPNPDAYQFHYIKNSFMNEEMIDVGTGSHPVFYDADADGLKDLLIASDFVYYTGGGRIAQIAYYRNTGTSVNPEFTLITRDYAGLAVDSFMGVYPTFGDIDGDGDDDMILGNTDASLTLFRNTAGAGNPSVFVLDSMNYQGISLGPPNSSMQSIPVLYDLNKDAKLDLVIGRRTGVLYYYENTGTATSPVFTYVTDNLGGVDVHDPWNLLGFSTPLFYDSAGVTQLLVGSYNGYIYHFNNIDGNLGGTFNMVDSIYQDIFEPMNAAPAMADINGDGLADMVVGNLAGGLRYYSQHVVSISDRVPDPAFKCYPNPASGIVNLSFNDVSSSLRNIQISNVLGHVVVVKKSAAKNLQLDVTNLSPGSYIITVDDSGKEVTQKLIIY